MCCLHLGTHAKTADAGSVGHEVQRQNAQNNSIARARVIAPGRLL
jgi:hypothetical protein